MLLIAVTDEGWSDNRYRTSSKNGFSQRRHSYNTSFPVCDCGMVSLYFTSRQRYDRCSTKLHEIASCIIALSSVNSHLHRIAAKRFRSAAKESSPVAVDYFE